MKKSEIEELLAEVDHDGSGEVCSNCCDWNLCGDGWSWQYFGAVWRAVAALSVH